ncbi:MAG: SDR family NAD(P)-dependent oxidoreductase [Thermodesulfobacteriota bacterium]
MTSNLIAIVTGGTKGIGLAIAKSLIKRGGSVALTYKSNDEAAQKAQKSLIKIASAPEKIFLAKGDSGDSDIVARQYQEISEKLGPANVLVNNAGIMPARSFDEISIDDWDETIRTNLSSSFYWCKTVVSAMKIMKFGRIINISSIAARGLGVVGPHYAASKSGMLGMTMYAARELGEQGITVNAIAPAFIEDAGIFMQWSEEKKKGLKEKILVSRIGNVNDVVLAFDYLIDSSFVTGVTLDVNGGAFMI